MRFYPKMNWDPAYSPINNVEQVKADTGWEVTTREEYEKKYGTSYVRPTCYQLWNTPRLSWDLSVTGCCWNTWERFNQDTVKQARQMLTGKIRARPDVPCDECEIYQGIEQTNTYLTKQELTENYLKQQVGTELNYYRWWLNL
jgi:hypothetical protein